MRWLRRAKCPKDLWRRLPSFSQEIPPSNKGDCQPDFIDAKASPESSQEKQVEAMQSKCYQILLIGEDPSRTQTYTQMLQEAEDASFEVARSEEHTSELQSQSNLVCRLLLEKKTIARCLCGSATA